MLELPIWPFYGAIFVGMGLCVLVYALEASVLIVGWAPVQGGDPAGVADVGPVHIGHMAGHPAQSAGRPPGEVIPFAERIRSFGRASPLLGVILVSIGGIYLGVFTPVEGSRIGAGLVILLAVASRSISRQGFVKAIQDTVRTSAMLYMIVIGANVLNPFLAITDIPPALGDVLTTLGLGAYGTLLAILLNYVVLDMFLDGLAMLVVSIPVYFPVIVGLGFDPIWFDVVAVIVIEMGMITPQVGLNVFVVRGVAGNVPLATHPNPRAMGGFGIGAQNAQLILAKQNNDRGNIVIGDDNEKLVFGDNFCLGIALCESGRRCANDSNG